MQARLFSRPSWQLQGCTCTRSRDSGKRARPFLSDPVKRMKDPNLNHIRTAAGRESSLTARQWKKGESCTLTHSLNWTTFTTANPSPALLDVYQQNSHTISLIQWMGQSLWTYPTWCGHEKSNSYAHFFLQVRCLFEVLFLHVTISAIFSFCLQSKNASGIFYCEAENIS